MKIAIIDDNTDFVEATRTLLEANDYTVVAAHNGNDGFALVKNEKPDLLLLDVMMAHDTEGFELANKLKDDPETNYLPVIIITGIRKEKGLPFSFEPDEEWLPVKAVLEKPVKPGELLAQIKSIVN